uniref:SWIM-type domain-containing protein n=1 Tax=Magallana gigas TaxID=29159 RepID=A0A8W8NZ12_MAGGI
MDVEFGEIYCYLVDSPGQFTRKTLKAYGSLEAYNFFLSGWVHTVYYSNLDCNDKCFLKAKVNRSQALSEKPHEALVCKKERWYHLECLLHVYGRVGEVCSHVAAILFKVEASVRLGYNKVACTSTPCMRNQTFTKKIEAVPLYQIIFKKPKKIDFHLSADPAPLDYDLVFESPDSFLQKLKQTNPTAVIFTVTDPIPNPPIPNPTLPKLLTSLYRSKFCSLSKTTLFKMP